MQQAEKPQRAELLLLIGAVAAAALLRLPALGSIPGFGYDEGTIGRLGRQILEGREYATGIKPYFGPLLIYLIALSYKLFGISIAATRLPVAVISCLMPIAAHLLTRAMSSDRRAGVAAAWLVAVSPWHVFFGRFAWDGNISPFFLTLFYLCIVRLVQGVRHRLAVAAAGFFCLGLTLNGHPYLLIPASAAALIAFIFSPASRRLLVASAPIAALPLLPVIAFQVGTGFKIYDRFFGGYNHHFALAAPSMTLDSLAGRFSGYLYSLAATLNGTLFYPDLYRGHETAGLLIPPILFVAALAYAIAKAPRNLPVAIIVGALAASLLVLPLIVKTQTQEKIGRSVSFTHYLDGVYPLPYVLIALALYSALPAIARRVPAIVTAALVVLTALHLKLWFFDYYRQSWGNGHFVAGLDRVIDRIDHPSLRVLPVQAMTAFTVSSSIYPQLETLTDWRLEPVEESLFEPHPMRNKKKLVRSPVLFVSRGRDALFDPVLAPALVLTSPDASQKWNVYIYESPAIYVRGKSTDGSEISLFCHLNKRGLVTGAGCVSAPDGLMRLEPRGVEAVGRFNNGKTIRIIGLADRRLPFELTLSRFPERRDVELTIDGRVIISSFEGTLCLF